MAYIVCELTPAGVVNRPATAAEIAAIPGVAASSVPVAVSRKAARLALAAANKLDAVTTAIESLPEPQRTAATIEWQDSVNFVRDSPMVLLIGGILGMTSVELDSLFIAAKQLE